MNHDVEQFVGDEDKKYAAEHETKLRAAATGGAL
jgi:hypothetical protein